MKITLLLSLIISSISVPEGYNLVWNDEFKNNSIDTSKWSFEEGTGEWGWGNNEKQYYTSLPTNAYISDNILHIKALKENLGGMSYTSARMTTKGKYSFKYGYIEAKIALPSGMGIWPAFWMLGNEGEWPDCGEINIVESKNTENEIISACHWSANGQRADHAKAIDLETDKSDFHTYYLQWDKEYIRTGVDNVQNFEMRIKDNEGETSAFHKPFFFILNVAVGGEFPGFNIDDNQFPTEMKVDYIRVYQKGAPTTVPQLIQTTLPQVIQTTEQQTIQTTVPQVIQTTEPQTLATTEQQTILTTEQHTIPKNESQTISTTDTQVIPTTEQQTITSTEQYTIPKNESQTIPTTEPQVIPSIEQQTIPTTEQQTIPSANENEQNRNSTELGTILLGFDNYSFTSNIINFFAYIKYFNSDPEKDLSFNLHITRNKNLRYLDNEDIQVAHCELIITNPEGMCKYNCSAENITKGFSKVEIKLDSNDFDTITNYARITSSNLQEQKGKRLSDKGLVVIDGCELRKENDNDYIIIGKNDSSFNNNSATLYVKNYDGKKVDFPSKINYKNNQVKIKLNPKIAVQAHLNRTLGMIDNDKNIFLLFDKEDYLYHTDEDNFFYPNKKKKSGLSGGAIVAIILPCIAVLLIIVFVAYLIGKKPSTQNEVEDNTMGINSSTDVIN